jgi:biotin-dependent carboxylase-like uncharacterized protein
MAVMILKPGMLTTFQDLGRFGQQHLGVSVAGAMDMRAHRLANLIVGNAPELATLEITLTGPTIRFTKPCCIALCGADLSATLNGQPLCLNRPIVVRAKDELAFGVRAYGTRAYLAVHGGFALTPVLGSTSTYLRSTMGGWKGRALRRDDEIPLINPLKNKGLEELAMDLWAIKIYLPGTIAQSHQTHVRLIKGQQWSEFTPESCAALLTEPYRISPDSERMGYRLEGTPLFMSKPRQMISEGTTFGTIQVPAGGQPIILMADRQTTGGYPKMAYVASIDLPRLAQMGPGDTVGFKAITLEQAQALNIVRARAFSALAQALQPVRTLLLNHREHHDTKN